MERHLAFSNAISFLLGLLLMYVYTLTINYALMCLLLGGTVHMHLHQVPVPCSYVLWR
jgi:hypothetical protein